MRCQVALLMVGLLGTSAWAQAGKVAPKYGWLTSLDQGRAEARRTGKPIFLVFRCEP